MALSDLNLKESYNNQKTNVVNDFLNPVLSEAIRYDRAVGFFSSTSLLAITVGIKRLIENGGTIRLICSPKLSEEDIKAINSGYEKRKVIEDNILREFSNPKDEFEEERLNMLANLIADGKLNIKIAMMKSINPNAMFHLKLGIVTDEKRDFVAFTGSMNDSTNAYYGNNETIDVFSSLGVDYSRAIEKRDYFNELWDNNSFSNTEVIDFPQVGIEKIMKYKKDSYDKDIDFKEERIKHNKSEKKSTPTIPDGIKIRDYQQKAYDAWKDNDYRGIYSMATGTGKTYTALYSMVNLLNNKNKKLAIVICCPYQHLVSQWVGDLIKFNFNPIIGYSSSPQKDWKKKLKSQAFNYVHDIIDSFCFITTNASFATKTVQNILNSINQEMLIVIDEAHNFGTNRLVSLLDDKYTYRLALSATLERHNDLVGTQRLYDFFEKKVAEYSLEEAIKNGMLCKYYYYPIKVYLSETELDQYNEYSRELAKYMKVYPDGSVEYSKKAEVILIKRARLVAGAQSKLDKLAELIPKFVDQNHLLVYCGATTVVDDDYSEGTASDDEIRQIEAVSKILYKAGITSSRFTSEEDAETREILKRDFNEGSIVKALVAIRCLDEGVNIPSIDKAIILASSTNPKEYIQRRGRVLRNYPGKQYAKIYDFVTLPRPLDEIDAFTDREYDLGLIKRELIRVKDFAGLSQNEYESAMLIDEIESIYGYIDIGDNYDG